MLPPLKVATWSVDGRIVRCIGLAGTKFMCQMCVNMCMFLFIFVAAMTLVASQGKHYTGYMLQQHVARSILSLFECCVSDIIIP